MLRADHVQKECIVNILLSKIQDNSLHYIQLILFMLKNKATSHTAASSVRTITISSNFKFDKVDKLNQLVKNITQRKVQTTNSQFQSKTLHGQEDKGVISEKVIETLKERIKTNYDQLYSNYSDNRQRILKQIQTVQTNIAGENHMSIKEEQVIKEKAKYDKLKTNVDQMQLKLKKLNDMRVQLLSQGQEKSAGLQLTAQYQQKLQDLEQKRQQIDHKNLVLQQMLKQRKMVELNLKERYNRLSNELGQKKEKMEKVTQQNRKKKQQILKLFAQIQKQEEVQIPVKLAQDLSQKIEQYENKHSYNQILQHEAVLEQIRYQKMKIEYMKKRQEQREAKLIKEKEQKNKLQEIQTLFMIGTLQQEKLKKLCVVQSINDVININLHLDQQSLEQVALQIQEEIQKLVEKNKQLQTQIQQLMIGPQQANAPELRLEQLNAKFQEQNTKKILLESELQKRSKLSNEWLTLMHLINDNRLSKQAQSQLVKQLMSSQKRPVNQKISEKTKSRVSSNLTEVLQSTEFK